MRDIIHFSHANGFPAGSYRKMLGFLERDFEVGYINAIGHNPNYPVTDCWPHLIEELIHHLESHYDRPVIGVGHSLGGFLTFLTAIQRPDLFKAIVMLDSPIMGRVKSTGLAFCKRFGLMERVTPAGTTKMRRSQWGSVEEAVDYFGKKELFAKLDPACLLDYVEHGTVPDADGIKLLFDPAIEYWIYCHLPHTYPRYRNQLSVPAGFIGGRDSHVVQGMDVRNMRRHYGILCRSSQGGHLFPMEHPRLAAEQITEMIRNLTEGHAQLNAKLTA